VATPFENFQAWYSNIVRSLYPERNAGFVILLAAFPLLERYGRQKLGLALRDDLSPAFHDEFVRIFPELANRDQANKVWSVYRNGLLHTVTLSTQTRKGLKLPVSLLSHDNSPPFLIDSNGFFWLNPVPFAERVLNTIENDFQTFEIGLGATTTFPRVYENIPLGNPAIALTGASSGTGIVTGTALPNLPNIAYLPAPPSSSRGWKP
jgi:hypothetical protein